MDKRKRAARQKCAGMSGTLLGAAMFLLGLLILAAALGLLLRAVIEGMSAGVYVASAAAIACAAAVIVLAMLRFVQSAARAKEPLSQRMHRREEEKRLLRGPKIVAIGGGTGLPALLRGLKSYTSNITAIVTVADNGGGTGRLRHDMGIVAPGDIRNCILALADAEPILRDLFAYRFQEGELRGQNFGNLYIAAMSEVSGGFMEAVRHTSHVLAVTGEVLPVTLESVELCAELSDGSCVMGESQIPTVVQQHGKKIRRVFLDKKCRALHEALDAIRAADVIVLGPGSLYTSVIAALLAGGMREALEKSRAAKIAVCNIMTQAGETSDYQLSDHVDAIVRHAGRGAVTSVIYNNAQDIDPAVLARYAAQGSYVVKNDVKNCEKRGVRAFGYDVVQVQGAHVRHDSDALGRAVMDVYRQTKLLDSMILHRIRE